MPAVEQVQLVSGGWDPVAAERLGAAVGRLAQRLGVALPPYVSDQGLLVLLIEAVLVALGEPAGE